MVGTASKKVNSTKSLRESRLQSPPIIIAPDRDTPGMMASVWNSPKIRAFLYEIVEISIIFPSSVSFSYLFT